MIKIKITNAAEVNELLSVEDYKKLIGAPENSTVQMFVRVGRADRVGPSPRRALNDFIRM